MFAAGIARRFDATNALRAALVLAAFAQLPAAPAPCDAQAGGALIDLQSGADAITRFTGPRWSLIRPARDYEGGCVVGFLAFQFSQTGYFVFNNRVRGSWRVDELGNLKLRTRDGVSFTMIVEGNILRPAKTLPFLSRTDLYQRCPA
jgi:hypothetical protein